MKGLLQYLPPFAPDQSGAVSALYELGGLIVILDAGGCTGNVCGFDEPRWFSRKSAVFSAGLRDMDAILGRDDKLIDKLQSAAAEIHAGFAALIGTPVPAVIGTDFRALRRMGEKRTGLPVLTVEARGVAGYDRGEETALAQVFETFAKERFPVESGTLGVLGATPLDLSRCDTQPLSDTLLARGWKTVRCYGMGAGLEDIRRASEAERNLAVSPAGVKIAEYLKKTFGTPYEVDCPLLPERLTARLDSLDGKRVLVIHQQVLANELRRAIRSRCPNAEVSAASWFEMRPELSEPQDFSLTGETQFMKMVADGEYDVVVGDELLRRALRDFRGEYWDFPHFAVSGRLENES